jgi:hypothetical protein
MSFSIHIQNVINLARHFDELHHKIRARKPGLGGVK